MRAVKLALLAVLALPVAAFAQMNGGQYTIWADGIGGGGGALNGEGYVLDSIVGGQASGLIESEHYRTSGGLAGIDPEPSLGLTVYTPSIALGKLTPTQTATATISFSAYTNNPAGYRIRLGGASLSNGRHAIAAIGPSPVASAPGTEQFGINVVANTAPAVGAHPDGGAGQALEGYDIPNAFAYHAQDAIAGADTFSDTTTYTASIIVNIAPDTMQGDYTGSLGLTLTATY